uniref:carboxypeptidase-like regulatory domain-containing protein n=1 Tax=Roseivirga sp. TaxID=1964215 RepID=UPI0040479645
MFFDKKRFFKKCNSKILAIQILFFLTIQSSLFSQTVQLKGYLLDTLTQQPIAYGHISVVGAGYGTYSNLDGQFSFNVPSREGLILKISSIGYESKNLILEELNISANMIIRLKPSIQELATFTVEAKKSKEKVNAKDIFSKAINAISRNRFDSALLLKVFYRQIQYIESKVDTQYLKLEEAALEIERVPILDNIKAVEVRSSFDERNRDWLSQKKGKSSDCEDRKRNLSQLLKSDYVFYNSQERAKKEIYDYVIWSSSLNSNFSKTHSFKFDHFDLLDGDLVYVIKILPSGKSPNYYPEFGKQLLIPVGKIVIREKDWGIMEMEYAYVINPLNRSKDNYYLAQIIVQGDILYKDVIRYRDFNGKLVLSYLSRDVKDFCASTTGIGNLFERLDGVNTYKVDEDESTSYYRTKHELFVNQVDVLNHSESPLNQDVYLSQPLNYNDSFWKSYNILPINNFDKRYIRKLETTTSLEEQFKIKKN